jgi:hypothetical protein
MIENFRRPIWVYAKRFPSERIHQVAALKPQWCHVQESLLSLFVVTREGFV